MTAPKISTCTDSSLGCFTEVYEKDTVDTDDYRGFYTRRGCMTADKTCPQGLCETCTTSNCNNKVFPKDRPRCLQCTNSDCSDAKSEYCRVLLQNNNECVSLFDDGSYETFSISIKRVFEFYYAFCYQQREVSFFVLAIQTFQR